MAHCCFKKVVAEEARCIGAASRAFFAQQEREKATNDLAWKNEYIGEKRQFYKSENKSDPPVGFCDWKNAGDEHGKKSLWLSVKCKVQKRILTGILNDPKWRKLFEKTDRKRHAGKHDDKIKENGRTVIIKIDMDVGIERVTEYIAQSKKKK